MVCLAADSTVAVAGQSTQQGVPNSPVLLGRKGRRLLNTKMLVAKKLGSQSEPAVDKPAPATTAPPNSPTTSQSAEDVCQVGGAMTTGTTFIFDWDDTLMPSSWMKYHGLLGSDGKKPVAMVTQAHQQQLTALATVACELIRQAMRRGTVLIITNAERGWVEFTCRKFLPALAPLLERINIISARSNFQGDESAMPREWKLQAFEKELRRVYGPDTILDEKFSKNVISVGDGPDEREALLTVAASLSNCRAKSVKFFDLPDVSELTMQQSLMTGFLDNMVSHGGNLDLSMKDSCNAQPASTQDA